MSSMRPPRPVPGYWSKDPFKPNNVNALGTLNVLKASLDAGVRRVINAVLATVYGKVQ